MDDIQRRLGHIEARLNALEARLSQQTPSVGDVLRQRGYEIDSLEPLPQVVLPRPSSSERLEHYYQLLHRYSFRILMRDVIHNRRGFGIDELLHYCSPRKAQRFVSELTSLGVVEASDTDRHRLVNQLASSFGDTLEWYVAQIFEREFASTASWGVKLRGLRSGGDYDVLALVGGYLVYAEVKSSPPRNIEQPAISGFFNRLDDVVPDLAIFLEDTHLKMEIKINLMFENEKDRRPGAGWLYETTQPLSRGVFRAGERVFIINSKPSIRHNLRRCLRVLWSRRPSP